MDTLTAIHTKRAVRDFSQQSVPEEVILKILDAGRAAQSSHNGQPWQFVVIRNWDTLQRLSECGRYAGHLAGAAFAIALVGEKASDDFDMGQAAAYLQLAGWELGVGSCLAAMWEPEKAKEILGIPAGKYFWAAISFGFPAVEQPREPISGRRPLNETVHWETWE